jgi:hypothetical protein
MVILLETLNWRLKPSGLAKLAAAVLIWQKGSLSRAIRVKSAISAIKVGEK